MRRLLLDTNLLLELISLEVRESYPGVERHFEIQLHYLLDKADRSAFIDSVCRQFGKLEYSSASVVELDRFGAKGLRGHRRVGRLEDLKMFWDGFHSLPTRFRREFVPRGFASAEVERGETTKLGPADAHLLHLIRSDADLTVATTDGQLQGAVRSIDERRLFDLRTISS